VELGQSFEDLSMLCGSQIIRASQDDDPIKVLSFKHLAAVPAAHSLTHQRPRHSGSEVEDPAEGVGITEAAAAWSRGESDAHLSGSLPSSWLQNTKWRPFRAEEEG